VIDAAALWTTALKLRLEDAYARTFGSQDPHVPEIATWAAELALENIARSDAPYHDVEHTVMVTWVGAELLRCQHLREGAIQPTDWLHFLVALLCHDIGYVRGVLQGDTAGRYITGVDHELVELPAGSTDARLMPWHVDRGMRFVRERFATSPHLDVELLAAHISYTRFPVPDDPSWHETRTLRGLARAADLIGQLSDPYYLRKIPALFREFQETGLDRIYGFNHPDEMRIGFPAFFERSVQPWIGYAIDLLRTTATGRGIVAGLHAHVYEAASLRR
jgi:hypothetical protein